MMSPSWTGFRRPADRAQRAAPQKPLWHGPGPDRASVASVAIGPRVGSFCEPTASDSEIN